MKSLTKFILLVLGFIYLVHFTCGEYLPATPRIHPSEKNVTVCSGRSCYKYCYSDNEGLNLKSEWYDPKGNKIPSVENPEFPVKFHGVLLRLENVSDEDAGTYTCVTPQGHISFNLTVLPRPSSPIVLDQELEQQTATEGENYKMRCASGPSCLRFYWKVDGKTPKPPKYKTTKDYGLIIHNVTADDTKKHYMCRAMDMESAIPKTKVMNVTLKVNHEPRWVTAVPIEIWGVPGERVNLTCSVYANPPARLKWLHESKVIPCSDDTCLFDGLNTSILPALVSNDTDMETYTCRAINEVGVLETNIIVYTTNVTAIEDGVETTDKTFSEAIE